MLEEITFVERVGVPVAAFVMMYLLYVNSQKWYREQQGKSEERYEKIVNRFIESVEKMTVSLQTVADELKRQNEKIEEHVRLKDRAIDLLEAQIRG